MGYDVSYHPISPDQMLDWYIASLASDDHAASICDQAGMNELYKQKLLGYLPEFRAAHGSDKTFDKTHGYYIAVTQGFFARYHYVRGAMLSSLGEKIAPYTATWADVLPELLGAMKADNRIVENYSSGVYVPPSKVAKLLVDVQTDTALQAELAPIFPGEHLSILVTALREAEQLGVGLLEATDLIEPNPLDLESTHCLTNLFNCDTAGPLLYQKTAQAQFKDLGLSDMVAGGNVERIRIDVDPETGEVTGLPAPTRTSPEAPAANPKQSGGFFSRFRRGR